MRNKTLLLFFSILVFILVPEYRAARENAYDGGAIFVHNRLRVGTGNQ